MEPLELMKRRLDGKNQREVAKEVPCSPAYLNDFLKGRRGPGPKILKYLGLEVVYRRSR